MAKQLVLLAPKGVTLCCPHGTCPIECPQEDHAAGWPLTRGIACESEELRLLVSMARNVLVSRLLCRWSQAAAFSCGSSGSWSCKGICLPGTPGAALRICKARGISWVSICPSVRCCGAVEGGGLTCQALQSRVT